MVEGQEAGTLEQLKRERGLLALRVRDGDSKATKDLEAVEGRLEALSRAIGRDRARAKAADETARAIDEEEARNRAEAERRRLLEQAETAGTKRMKLVHDIQEAIERLGEMVKQYRDAAQEQADRTLEAYRINKDDKDLKERSGRWRPNVDVVARALRHRLGREGVGDLGIGTVADKPMAESDLAVLSAAREAQEKTNAA